MWATTLEKGVFQCMNKYVLSIPDAATTLTTDDSQLTISFASKKIGVISTTDSLTYIPPPANLQKGEVPNTYLRTKNSIYYGTSNDLYYITNNKIISVKGDPRSPIIPKKMIFSGGDTLLAITNYYLITLLNGKKLRFLRQLFPLNCIVKLANKKILIGSRI